MPGNWQALFGKRPTEKDPSHGHLAGGPLHSEVRAGETDRLRGRHRAPVRPYTFAWLGRFRRLSKDYEFLPATSEAVIYLAVIQLPVRRLASK